MVSINSFTGQESGNAMALQWSTSGTGNITLSRAYTYYTGTIFTGTNSDASYRDVFPPVYQEFTYTLYITGDSPDTTDDEATFTGTFYFDNPPSEKLDLTGTLYHTLGIGTYTYPTELSIGLRYSDSELTGNNYTRQTASFSVSNGVARNAASIDFLSPNTQQSVDEIFIIDNLNREIYRESIPGSVTVGADYYFAIPSGQLTITE